MAKAIKGGAGIKGGVATRTNVPVQRSAPATKKVAEGEGGRPILFDKITVCGIEIPEENLLVSADDMKVILGWETESEHEARLTDGLSPEVASKMNVKYGSEYDFIDYNGEKVRLSNNVRNRPLDMRWLQELANQVLSEYWRFNGEAAIIGQTGLALSLQHRGLALIWAEQMRSYEGDDEEKKAKAEELQAKFPDPLAIPMLVVRGIEETPDVTRTIDNVRPRSLSDVLFADTSLFHKTAKADREKLCRITDYAIRTVQSRTGELLDAFAPTRAHSASLEFLSRHPRLLKAVNHIFTEVNKKNKEGEKINVLSNYITPGTAAGLMFLMGASTSDRERWDNAGTPNDRHLDFERWEMAELFWTGVGDSSNKEFDPVRKAIAACGNPTTGAQAPVPVRVAVLVNAWNEYVEENGAMTVKNIMPEFGQVDENGRRPLVSVPACATEVEEEDGTKKYYGIDLGDAKAVRKEEEEAAAEEAAEAEAEAQAAAEGGAQTTVHEPSSDEQEEVQARTAEVKKQSLATKAGGAPKKGGLRGGTGR